MRNTKPKWVRRVDMLEAGLNPTSDPTSQFVTQGEKRGTGYDRRASAVRERSLGTNTMTKRWVCGHAPLRL